MLNDSFEDSDSFSSDFRSWISVCTLAILEGREEHTDTISWKDGDFESTNSALALIVAISGNVHFV